MLTCLGVATLLLTPSSIAGSLRVRYSRTKKEELTKYALYLPVIRDIVIRVPRFSLYPLVKKWAARRHGRRVPFAVARCDAPPRPAPAPPPPAFT